MRRRSSDHAVGVLSYFVVAVLVVFTVRADASSSASNASGGGVDIKGMDRATAPGDDFFRYANGAWLKTTEIPADRSYDGATYALFEKTQEQTRQLLEGIDRNATGDERQVKDYYDTLIDEAAIEAQGLGPLQTLLANVSAIQDRQALATYICGDLRADVDALNSTNFETDRLFGLWFAADLNEPTRYAAFLLQGGLVMPDRDYYLDASAGMEKTRASYLAHIETMLTLAKIPDAKAKAARIFALERKIAEVHATRTESVDVKRANNPWTREEFPTKAPGLDWPACFRAAGLDYVPRVIVWHPGAVRGSAALVGREPLETWRDYLTFHVIDRYAAYLPKAFGDQSFAFHGKVLTGAQEPRARWKRAIVRDQRRARRRRRQAVRAEVLPGRGEEAAPGDGQEHHRGIRAAHRQPRLDDAHDESRRQSQTLDAGRRCRLSRQVAFLHRPRHRPRRSVVEPVARGGICLRSRAREARSAGGAR